jgi:hypothetical protein
MEDRTAGQSANWSLFLSSCVNSAGNKSNVFFAQVDVNISSSW